MKSHEKELLEIIAMPGIREAIAVPRATPRDLREAIAILLASELVTGETLEIRDHDQTARRLGPLFYILNAARNTETWEVLKSLCSRNRMIALLCLRSTLEALLDTIDQVSNGQLPEGGIEAITAFNMMIAETLSLWGRKPGDNPMSADHAQRGFYRDDDRIRLVHRIAHQGFLPRLEDLIDEISESMDAIEITDLLTSGRGWDHAIMDMQHEDIHNIKRYSDIVGRSRSIKEMIDDLGRASSKCSSAGKQVLRTGKSEIHSIITSSDVSYMLPSELIKLQDDILKYLFFARLSEGKLLTYQLHDRGKTVEENQQKKGPVIALVDTSGSMDGAPGIIAKAIVLAVARSLLKDGRNMIVALFSSVGQVTEIELPSRPFSGFLDFLRSTFGGGTDFDTALSTGLQALERTRFTHADLLFITDGMSQLTDPDIIDRWHSLKSNRDSQIFTVIVGNDQAGGLEKISDRVYIFGTADLKKSIHL
ncbi:MAG TPA: VWA domain-containing protein [Methanocella sp.]|nr:VWA domain-containing protein [Methanocella sp.]